MSSVAPEASGPSPPVTGVEPVHRGGFVRRLIGRGDPNSFYADEDALDCAIEATGPPPESARYLSDRYLPYTRFCEDQAKVWRIGYYWLRIPTIVLATVVPALVAANLGTGGRLLATGLGIVIAALSGIEHFMNVGGRWRHYRAAVELLKSEGWLYLTRAGSYAKADDLASTLPAFAQQIEHMIRTDVSSYVTLIDTDKVKEATTDANQSEPPRSTSAAAKPENDFHA